MRFPFDIQFSFWMSHNLLFWFLRKNRIKGQVCFQFSGGDDVGVMDVRGCPADFQILKFIWHWCTKSSSFFFVVRDVYIPSQKENPFFGKGRSLWRSPDHPAWNVVILTHICNTFQHYSFEASCSVFVFTSQMSWSITCEQMDCWMRHYTGWLSTLMTKLGEHIKPVCIVHGVHAIWSF